MTIETQYNNLTKRAEKAESDYIKSVEKAEIELSKAKERCTEKIYRATEITQDILKDVAERKRYLQVEAESAEMAEGSNL